MFFFNFLLLLCVINIQTSTIPCGKNEVYSECGNNGCQNTCDNPNLMTVCRGTCIAGCVCQDGFLRNEERQCVLPKDCHKCEENEIFECGSACDTECSRLNEPCPIVNIMCNNKCYCKNGYARNNQDVCVPLKQCPDQ